MQRSFFAIKKLVYKGKIQKHQSVVMLLTGAGIKDSGNLKHDQMNIIHSDMSTLEEVLKTFLLKTST